VTECLLDTLVRNSPRVRLSVSFFDPAANSARCRSVNAKEAATVAGTWREEAFDLSSGLAHVLASSGFKSHDGSGSSRTSRHTARRIPGLSDAVCRSWEEGGRESEGRKEKTHLVNGLATRFFFSSLGADDSEPSSFFLGRCNAGSVNLQPDLSCRYRRSSASLILRRMLPRSRGSSRPREGGRRSREGRRLRF